MAPRGFDRFMVDVDLGSNLKVGRFTDAEFRCLVSGVWPVAAKATPRGTLTVGGQPATSKDIAHQAHCSATVAKRTVEKMAELRMLDYDEDHGYYSVHDWDQMNPAPRVDTTGTRRQALFRNVELRHRIRDRDGDRCRYCGVTVNWNDRRGRASGTYDHVDPSGPNTEENLVVACRSCNSSKRDRLGILPRSLEDLDSDLGPDLDPGLNKSRTPSREARTRASTSTSSSSSKEALEDNDKEITRSAQRADVSECFDYWRDRCKHPNAKLTREREQKVLARFAENYTVLDVRLGIDGAATNPPRDRDSGVVHDDLVSICRNGAQLERYMGRASSTVQGANVVRMQRSAVTKANAWRGGYEEDAG